MSNPYEDDRGNKDVSVANPQGRGTTDTTRKSGAVTAVEGGPFLIGDAMTGGYGAKRGWQIDGDEGCVWDAERALWHGAFGW